jgi:hypothetical protein
MLIEGNSMMPLDDDTIGVGHPGHGAIRITNLLVRSMNQPCVCFHFLRFLFIFGGFTILSFPSSDFSSQN